MRNNPTMVPPYPANDSALGLGGSPFNDYLSNSSGQRIQTTSVEIKAIRAKHPDRHLTIVSPSTIGNGMPVFCDLLGFAASDQAKATLNPEVSETIIEHGFVPPARRHGGEEGAYIKDVRFAAYDYEYQGTTYLLYVFHASEGIYQMFRAQFILSPPGSKKADGEADEGAVALITAATKWGQESHEEAWVFDRGFWAKDKDLYKSIQESSWDNVILDGEKKQAMIDDVEGFFSSEENYKAFSVPWKVTPPTAPNPEYPFFTLNLRYIKSYTDTPQRGIIFCGPPGNGKTISIKALMHTLSQRQHPTVEMLYVKSFNSFQGPEYGILAIFTKARQMAPCMLIFEDIDSLVNPSVRSYFLNAVDGLESNHGILMIGSTNHLERLDPGIAKRPSRFDRKYLFALPVREERVQYAQYWRKKLSGNKKIAFPEVLCGMIADITDAFSFAYMKEAFVAALLVIVVSKGDSGGESAGEPKRVFIEEQVAAVKQLLFIGNNVVFGNSVVIGGSDDDHDGRKQAGKTPLWKEIQRQVKILRDEMDNNVVQERIKQEIAAVDMEAGLYRMSITPSRFQTSPFVP